MSKYVFFLVSMVMCRIAVAQPNSFVPGTVTDTVLVTSAPAYSYALFVPSTYTSDTSWPVLFIYDPAARGTLAATVFKAAAEKYGYILAASNNSKNGSMNANFMASTTMQEDVFLKLNIDKKRIYTCGFSGGSRMASAVAILQKNVAGIIACGAGMPSLQNGQSLIDTNVVYAATAGFEDMNFTEMRKLETTLNTAHVHNKFFYFNGIHDWPPASLAMQTIEWLELYAMKKNIKPIDKKWITSNYIAQLDSAKQDISSQHYFYAYHALNSIITDFFGLLNIDDAQQLLNTLNENKSAKKDIANAEQTLAKENTEIENYADAMYDAVHTEFAGIDVKPDDWWTTSGDDLRRQQKSSDIYKAQMSVRLLDMISLNCNEQGNNYMQQGNAEYGKRIYHVWALTEPDNAYAWYHLAESESMLNETDHAMEALQHAKKNGLTKSSGIETNIYFANLKSNKSFIKFITTLNADK